MSLAAASHTIVTGAWKPPSPAQRPPRVRAAAPHAPRVSSGQPASRQLARQPRTPRAAPPFHWRPFSQLFFSVFFLLNQGPHVNMPPHTPPRAQRTPGGQARLPCPPAGSPRRRRAQRRGGARTGPRDVSKPRPPWPHPRWSQLHAPKKSPRAAVGVFVCPHPSAPAGGGWRAAAKAVLILQPMHAPRHSTPGPPR